MNPRILLIKNFQDIITDFKKIGVHKDAFWLMAPKAISCVIKLKDLPVACCNIIKQEMLSLGGDAAVRLSVITGSQKRSDCLIIGSYLQVKRLCKKLKRQPLGLDKISCDLENLLLNYFKKDFVLRCADYSLNLGKRTHIMGVLNITPDSFSDGGLFFESVAASARAFQIEKEGADIIDIGGESTRPHSSGVSSKEEIKRVIPVIKKIIRKIKIPISIDTSKSEVAHAALDLGAAIVNDITGLKTDRKIARLIARYNAGCVLMHIKGTPRTMQKNPKYKDLISEIINSLSESIDIAKSSGIKDNNIIIDPGIGFGKTTEHNLYILKNLAEFKSLGYPVAIGTSRKSFIGNVLHKPVSERLIGTAGTAALAINNGADIVRVHDVKEIYDVVKMTDAVIKSKI